MQRKRVLTTFERFYFDPHFSSREICQLLGLSKTTFYRYEKELKAPKLSIGLGSFRGTSRSVLKKWTHGGPTLFDYDLIRLICKELRVRGKIYLDETQRIIRRTENGEFDFSLGSFSANPFRSQRLSFSTTYFKNRGPGGIVFSPKNKGIDLKEKPRLGVIGQNIHHFYTQEKMQREFEIKTFSTFRHLTYSVEQGLCDFALYSPAYLTEKESQNWKRFSKLIPYPNSHTCAIFSVKRDQWLAAVNKATHTILEENLIDETCYFANYNE